MPSDLFEDTDTGAVFLDCPAYLDGHGTARCELAAEVEGRYTLTATDGPLEAVRIRCPRGHFFNGPLEALTFEQHLEAAISDRADPVAPVVRLAG